MTDRTGLNSYGRAYSQKYQNFMKERLIEQHEEHKKMTDKAKEKQMLRETNKRRRQYEQLKMEKLKKEAEERERLLASRRRKMNQENSRMRTATRQIDQPDENSGRKLTPNMMIKHEPKSNKEKRNRLRDDILSYYESSGLTKQDIILGGTTTSNTNENDGSSLADQFNTLPQYQSTINKETIKTSDNDYNRRQKEAFIDEANNSYEHEKYQDQISSDDGLSSVDSLEIGKVSVREGKSPNAVNKHQVNPHKFVEKVQKSSIHKSNSNILTEMIDDDDDDLFDSLDLTSFQLQRFQNNKHDHIIKVASDENIRPSSTQHCAKIPIKDNNYTSHQGGNPSMDSSLSRDGLLDSQLHQPSFKSQQHSLASFQSNQSLKESNSSAAASLLHDDDQFNMDSQLDENSKKNRIGSAKSTKSVRFADTTSYHGLSDASSLSDELETTTDGITDQIDCIQLSENPSPGVDHDKQRHTSNQNRHRELQGSSSSRTSSTSRLSGITSFGNDDDTSDDNDDSVDPWKLNNSPSHYQQEEMEDAQSQFDQSTTSTDQFHSPHPVKPIQRHRSDGSMQGRIKSNHTFKSLATVEDSTKTNLPTDDEVNWLWDKVQQCLEQPSENPDENSKKKLIKDKKSQTMPTKTPFNISKRIPSAKIRRSSITSAHSDTVLLNNQDHSSRIPRKITSAKVTPSAKIHLNPRREVQQQQSKHTKPYPYPVKKSSTTNSNGNHFNNTTPQSSTHGPVRSSSNKSMITKHGNIVQPANITESVANFMMAESLCKKSLSESQIEKLLRTNNTTKRKPTKPSALSIEERRLLASIQRLDEKLQETTAANAELIRKHLAGIETFKPQLRKRSAKANQPIRPQQFYEMNIARKANKQSQWIKTGNMKTESNLNQNRTVRL